MARAHVECASLLSGPARTFHLDGVATGATVIDLSRDSATGAESLLLRLPAFWHWPVPGHFEAEVELLVLSGSVRFGAQTLQAGDFAVYGAQRNVPTLDSETGCELLWLSTGATKFVRESTSPHPSPFSVDPIRIGELPWKQSPSFIGRSAEEAGPQLHVKYLRGDPQKGAYTAMTRHAAGWSEPKLESHSTWEELVLLEGDFLMGNTGIVAPGCYIFRPERLPHGPQVTRHGAIWLCRGERRIDFKFDSQPWVAERSSRYLETAAAQEPARAPWNIIW
jgi:hypothetical protein